MQIKFLKLGHNNITGLLAAIPPSMRLNSLDSPVEVVVLN